MCDCELPDCWGSKSYFSKGRKLYTIRTFHIYCPILVKFGITDLHLTLSNHSDFRENRRSKAHTFLKGVNLTLTYFPHLFPILVNSGITDRHLKPSSHSDFRENRRSKVNNFLKGVTLTLSHFPHLLSDFGEIWYYRSTLNAVGPLRFS